MWGDVKNLAQFDIDIIRLSNKQHQYQYHIDKNFFEQFENSPVQQANLDVSLTLDKQENIITANYDIQGTVELECDRSLEKFDYPIAIQERIIYQYGEEERELDDEIVIITDKTQSISIAQYLYEFVNLAVPMRKIHPKYAEDEDPMVDGEIIFSSKNRQDEGSEEEETDEPVDPRWNALKNLKNLN